MVEIAEEITGGFSICNASCQKKETYILRKTQTSPERK